MIHRGAEVGRWLADLRDRVGIGVREGPVEVLLTARERRRRALRIRGAPGRRRRRVLEATKRILAEGAEDLRLAVPQPRDERGLRHRPRRDGERDPEPDDL